MATLEDVVDAIKHIAKLLKANEWYPKRVTHVEKEAYSLLFLESDAEKMERITSAVRAIADVQREVNRNGWKNDPLVLAFPMGRYRLNVFIPEWRRIRGRRIQKLRGIPLRAYSLADRRIVEILDEIMETDDIGLISNTVQETLAAYAWKLTRKPDAIARNVELTIPTPYPDPIRARTRALRDYGITVSEFDAIGDINGKIILMEAKAASGGPRRWENIIRRKIRAYKGAMRYIGVRMTADFVITSNNGNVAMTHALRARTELERTDEFDRGLVIAGWARNNVEWRVIR